MRPIIFPLKPGDQNEAVANLHNALLYLWEKLIVKIDINAEDINEMKRDILGAIDIYNDYTILLITAFQEQENLQATGEVDQPTADRLNALLRKHGGFEQQSFVKLRGYITNYKNEPVPGVMVKAYDKDLRSEELLGGTLTNDKGSYEISYKVNSLSNEKKTADILLRVFNDAGEQLYESSLQEILWNVSEDANFNIVLKNYINKKLSEFEHLLYVLRPLVGSINIKELAEDGRYQDVSFLAAKSGISFLHLEYFILSHKLSSLHNIAPHFFYAILRQQTFSKVEALISLELSFPFSINSDITSIWFAIVTIPTETLIKAIEEAIAQKIINESFTNELDDILAQLRQHKLLIMFLLRVFLSNTKTPDFEMIRRLLDSVTPKNY